MQVVVGSRTGAYTFLFGPVGFLCHQGLSMAMPSIGGTTPAISKQGQFEGDFDLGLQDLGWDIGTGG